MQTIFLSTQWHEFVFALTHFPTDRRQREGGRGENESRFGQSGDAGLGVARMAAMAHLLGGRRLRKTAGLCF